MPRTRSHKTTQQSDCQVLLSERPCRRKQINKISLSKGKLRNIVARKFQSQKKEFKQRKDCLEHKNLQEMVPLDKLNCPICMEALIVPTLTQCGHSFCLPCVEQSMKYKGACPICRASLNFDNFMPSLTISSLLEQKLSKDGPDSLAHQQEREKVFRENDQKCRIGSDAKVGDLIDFWAERKWREGKVVDINASQIDGTLTVEPTQHWPVSEQQSYDFPLNSRLIVKHRTHTKEEVARLSHRGVTQFRIEIRNIGDEEPLFFELMGHRRMEFALRDVDESNDSMVRFALSFQRRRNQQQ